MSDEDAQASGLSRGVRWLSICCYKARMSIPPSNPSDVSRDLESVEAVVVALIPEFHQVKVRGFDGRLYTLTRATKGIELDKLHEGDKVRCTVTVKLPRVLSASVSAST